MYHLVYLFFSQKPFSSTQMLQHSSCGHFCTFNSICGLHLINLIIYGGKFHFSPLQLQKIPQNLATVNNFPDHVEKEIKEPQIYEHFILFDFNQRRQSAQQMALVTVWKDGATNAIHMMVKAFLWVDAILFHIECINNFKKSLRIIVTIKKYLAKCT